MKRHECNTVSLAARSWNAGNKEIFLEWFHCLLLIGLVLVTYSRTWHAGFIWDDESHLTENPAVIGPLGLCEIWTTTSAVYYPLVLTTFWCLHKIVGLNPVPYHVLNLVLHAGSAILLWRVFRKLGVPGAWFGAALWALHPVMVQSVAWITELKNTQSCFFYLLSILCFLNAQNQEGRNPMRRRQVGLAFLFFVMAITSKASTVMLPAVLALCLWWRNHQWRWKDGVRLLPFVLISAAASVWTIWEQQVHAGATGPEWAQTWPERIIIAGRAIWFYLGKLFWPHPLIFIYPRWEVHASHATAYLPFLLAIVALLLLVLQRHSWKRSVIFAVAYFMVSLFPVLGFFSVYFFRYSFVSDHFQYLASIGPLALLAAGITRGMVYLNWRWTMRATGCGMLLLVLSLLSWQQIGKYRDAIALYNSTLEKNPGCWMAHYNLGISLRAKGETDQAIDHYQKAIALRPDYVEAHYNLARLLADRRDFDGAIAHYEQALTANPADAEVHNNLGATLSRVGRTGEALIHYRKALVIRPDYAEAASNTAHALLQQGQTDEAITYYERAVRLKPGDADLNADLGGALALAGRTREAIVQYRRTLAVAPEDVTAQSNLAWILSTSPDPELRNGAEAVRLAERADRLTGGTQPMIIRILAAANAEAGNFANATQIARHALQLAELNNTELARLIQVEIALYESHVPYHKRKHD